MGFTDPSYEDLKIIYFQLLGHKNAHKGDIRAFVGFQTQKHESNLININNPLVRHTKAFNQAINDLEILLKLPKKEFREYFNVSLLNWRLDNHAFSRLSANIPLKPAPIPHIREWNPNGYKLVSLFSGAFGLDLGFLASGFELKFATDIDKLSFELAARNLPNSKFILENFDNVSSQTILDIGNLKVGETDVLVGGPPCQPFSTAGKREGFNDPRSSPLKGFIRAINDLKPKAFLMEEVPGLQSARLKHVPINERGSRTLLPEEQEGSAFIEVLNMLKSTGYNFVYGKLNAADFGAPQVRERLVFIGLREGIPSLPEPSHTEIPGKNLYSSLMVPWTSYWEAVADLPYDDNEYVNLSKSMSAYMEFIPPGGHWRHLPEEIIPEAMGGAYESGGGKMGFYRRLAWDEPSPTVVTSPIQKGTLLIHPELDRPLTIREYKRIQGFPDDWDLPGKTMDKYKLIGNAVSVHFSNALAKHIITLIRN